MFTTWQQWIDAACGAGWKVQWREELQGYVVISPKAFRRAPEELGWYATERDAWHAAAFMFHKREREAA